jgi:hypothetical protein
MADLVQLIHLRRHYPVPILPRGSRDLGILGVDWDHCPVPMNLSQGQAADLGGSVSAARIFTVAGARLPSDLSHFAVLRPVGVFCGRRA